MTIRKYGRYWAVCDAAGVLVVVAVDQRGALEVARRLAQPGPPSTG